VRALYVHIVKIEKIKVASNFVSVISILGAHEKNMWLSASQGASGGKNPCIFYSYMVVRLVGGLRRQQIMFSV